MFDSIESIQNASVINTDNGGHQIACCHKTIIIDLHSITVGDPHLSISNFNVE